MTPEREQEIRAELAAVIADDESPSFLPAWMLTAVLAELDRERAARNELRRALDDLRYAVDNYVIETTDFRALGAAMGAAARALSDHAAAAVRGSGEEER